MATATFLAPKWLSHLQPTWPNAESAFEHQQKSLFAVLYFHADIGRLSSTRRVPTNRGRASAILQASFRAAPQGDRLLTVLRIDKFGNIITNPA
jgi:hypothetical protein